MIIAFARRADAAAAGISAVFGIAAALYYHRLGLTLTHYDARGHLVVARRILDSITPGWQQIGAVWLPLPHLLNMIPVQIDWMYRTGASAVGISIIAFALAAGSIAWIVQRLTRCAAAAFAAAAVFTLNPNVLYLQSTPMTEPLLLGLTTLAIALLMRWSATPSAERPRSATPSAERVVGWAFALACLTRYEAWPVTVAALAIAVFARARTTGWRAGVEDVGRIAIYPAVAVAAFFVFSRVVIGEWFVAGGFFVPENKALGRPVLAAAEIWWGTHTLSGYLVIVFAAAGLAILLARGLGAARHRSDLLPLALIAAAALPWAAFVKGHPFRIRYMVPLIALEAIGAGAATLAAGRATPIAAALLLAAALFDLRPFDRQAPMVLEAQWDRPNMAARDRVTDCLRAHYDDEKVMASMGSLGHYMQEASKDGFAIRDFLHEGNGDIWLAAVDEPRPFAGWILIEEKAEGGDMLAQRAREDPAFLAGYTRVCDGAGMVLYRRKGLRDKGNVFTRSVSQ